MDNPNIASTLITQYLLLAVGLACLVGALVLLYAPRRVAAAAPAYAGMVALHCSYYIQANSGWLLFWGAAAAMVAALVWLQPAGEIDGNRSSNLYVASSALAGALLGIVVDPRVMVLGTIVGALVGQLAYSRTPAGRWLAHGGGKVMAQYYAAKCLPAVVAVSIIGISVEGFLL